nr:hypothetical protein [uncultured Chryseobacterium sp.]
MVFDLFKGEIPTDILGSLNNTIPLTFFENKLDYWQGTKSLRNFKRNIPIPLPVKYISKMRYDSEQSILLQYVFDSG